jgi:hypothetical protein
MKAPLSVEQHILIFKIPNVSDGFVPNLGMYLLRLPEFTPSIILCNCLAQVNSRLIFY